MKITSNPTLKFQSRAGQGTNKSFSDRYSQTYPKAYISCFNCGRRDHISSAENCPAKGKICHSCNRVGHFESRCRFRKSQTKSTIQKSLVDSGSDANLITNKAWESLKQRKLTVFKCVKGSNKVLRDYASDVPLTILGTFVTDVKVADKSIRAEFYVIEGGQRCLLGNNTAKALGILRVGLDIQQVQHADKPFPKINDVQVHIHMDSEAKPVFQPLRRIPIPLESAVNRTLEQLLNRDIIERKEGPASWVSPLVMVGKSNGEPRICLDLRRVNEAVLRERHPMPTVDDYLARLGEGKYWSKLDIKEAFLQIELAPESRDVTTFITNTGLYRFKRLPFGIVTAPEMFQKS
ncbi:uncharacterized protein K02A2.6-like isoform X8 [Topomyia yanbarensis]|uniref:uncharacterized protein K02A2.6-like isoform X8 n=1 Tax=Topomyia yanbarensis TaxID=2498891 RepID=UPI00273AA4E2|nr:uncharacterized protein K02A2.6-like isoform X8 [Topomyia yanbarensis]